jgi:tetratricopeptide (TPR) repeat protein
LVLSGTGTKVSGQSSKTDSLTKLIRQGSSDTSLVINCVKLADLYSKVSEFDSSLVYSAIAIETGEKLRYKRGLARSYSVRGITLYYQGNYTEALKNHFSSLKIRDELGDKQGAANSYNNIANVYIDIKNLPEALKYHQLSLKMRKEINDQTGIGMSYNNIANVYRVMGKLEESLAQHLESMRIREATGDVRGLATSYNNIGGIYSEWNDFNKAMEYYRKSLELNMEMGDKKAIAGTYHNIGAVNSKKGNLKEAEKYFSMSTALAEEIGSLDQICIGNRQLSHIYEKTGRYKEAFDCYKKSISINDSLLSDENTKATVRMQMNYEFGKKEIAAKLEQEKKDAIAQAESRKQKIVIWSVCGILLLVAAFAVFAYRSFRQKKRANVEIMSQKNIIEEKQKEILDSIYYARKIQRALVTNEHYIERHLSRLNKRG